MNKILVVATWEHRCMKSAPVIDICNRDGQAISMHLVMLESTKEVFLQKQAMKLGHGINVLGY